MEAFQGTSTNNSTHPQVEIGAEGDVVVFADEANVEHKPAITSGVSVEVADEGKLIIYTDGAVTMVPPDFIAKPGQQIDDGTFYLGRFEDKNGVETDYYAAAEDEKDKAGKRLFLDFKQAVKHASKSKAHGYKDWEVPAAGTLEAIFNLKADINGLELVSSDPFLGYRTSEPSEEYPGYTKVQRLTDGARFNEHKSRKLPVRLVRSVAV